jgi:DNA-binding PadR family transcriptional regulator
MHGRGGRGCGPRGGWDRWAAQAEGRFEGFRHEGRGGGGGRRRMFDGGELRLVLLRMIADEPRHGYELIKAVEELTGGAYVPSPGMVYPALTMLAEMELIAEQPSETARKRFVVTAAGEAHLAEHEEQVAMLMARLAEAGTERNRVGWMRAPIQRAMGNLRHAIQHRLPKGSDDDEALFEIAAILDDAAQKIERLK